jgi:Ca2+-binding RTX toxin-like protein
VQNDGAITQYFGKNLVNTVADGIYHIGFNIQDNRLLNEDGDANARLNDVSSWLNYFYLQKTIIYGDNSSDTITGTNLAEHLMGYGGNDVLSGGGGDDLIDGDWGCDTLSGGVGNDLLYGGADNDQLDGGEDSDTYYVSGNLAGGWSSFQG